MTSVFTLREFIAAVLSGGFLLGPVIWKLVDYFKIGAALDLAARRALVAVICGLLGIAVWGLGVVLGYVPSPSDTTSIAEAIWANGVNMALTAFLSASLIHGYASQPPAPVAPVEES